MTVQPQPQQDDDRRSRAYREAARAVIAMAQHRPIYELRLDGASSFGDMPNHDQSFREAIWREVCWGLTAPVATARLVRPQHDQGERDEQSYARAQALARLRRAGLADTASVEAWLAATWAQLGAALDTEWEIVEIIAEALLERGHLTSEEMLQVLLDAPDPLDA